MNRLTNMVDAAGASGYTYDHLGHLRTEDGPWADDTVTITHTNGLRASLGLPQPGTTAWTQSYGYDDGHRPRTIGSPAGTFTYSYPAAGVNLSPASRLPVQLALPTGSIALAYDTLARLTNTVLRTGAGLDLNAHGYQYNNGSQRTRRVDAVAGNYVDYRYDALGQLTNGVGYEYPSLALRHHERWAYGYDKAGNLTARTNNLLVQTFTPNSLNELGSVTASGTLTVAGTVYGTAASVTVGGTTVTPYADHTFARTNVSLTTSSITARATDAQGRASTNTITLHANTNPTLTYESDGDLMGRIQATGSDAPAASFGPSALSLFAYRSFGDMLATRFVPGAEMRDAIAFLPATWTRRTDGSRTLTYDAEHQLVSVVVANDNGNTRSDFVYDGLGRRRIRTEAVWQGGAWVTTRTVRYIYDGNRVLQERDGNNAVLVTYTRGMDLSGTLEGAGGVGGLLARTHPGDHHFYYHADGNGNVTAIVNANNTLVAQYRYDPFGNLLSQSGPLAEPNLYRFSSKEFHAASGLYYYGFWFYDPNLQRWITRDPIGERGGLNLYGFAGNDPVNWLDYVGLAGAPTASGGPGGARPVRVPPGQQAKDPIVTQAECEMRAKGYADPREMFSRAERARMAEEFLARGPSAASTSIQAGRPPASGNSVPGLGVPEQEAAARCSCPIPGWRTAAESATARNYFKNRKDLARQIWEETTGREWPRDENGNPWPAEHTPPLKEGGPPMRVTPRNPGAPDPHGLPGPDGRSDYQRWGALGTPAREANK